MCAARSADTGTALVVESGRERPFLAPLPVGWIPSSQEVRRRLDLFGLRRMGQLADLTAGALAEQFGPEGAGIQRLARGVDERPVMAREMPLLLEEGMDVDPPAEEANRLLSLAGVLAERLAARL